MIIPKKLKLEILTHCKATEPKEACGFVVSRYQDSELIYLPCENVAVDPVSFFEILPDDFIQAEQQGEIVAVVHSHPNGEMRLSIADRQMQDNAQLDFWLICNGELQIYPKIRPLVGRMFDYGTDDCFTIFRDFYFLSGADFCDVSRIDGWWSEEPDKYINTLHQFGFEQTKDIGIGDVILMCFGADTPNHAAIYLGDQLILHHTNEKRLSRREIYNDYWQKHTHSIWRLPKWHLSQLDFTVALNHLARSLS